MAKELLFSVTKDDFDWEFLRGSGKGGQKRNKTSNCCRCVHRASGAVGYACDHREQSRNRRAAFERAIATSEFKAWHRSEVNRLTTNAKEVNEAVAIAMAPENIREECYDPKSR